MLAMLILFFSNNSSFKRPVIVDIKEKIMKFSSLSLRSTARSFEHSLISRDIKLPYQRTLDLWAKIVVGKPYSAAMAQADATGSILAGKITAQSIIDEISKVKNLTIDKLDKPEAIAVFSDSIWGQKEVVSFLLSELNSRSGVYGDTSICFISLVSTSLALIDDKEPGYMPLDAFLAAGDTDEAGWIVNNSEFVVDLLNQRAGLSEKKCTEIFFANHRLNREREDEVFCNFLRAHAEELSQIVQSVVTNYLDELGIFPRFVDLQDLLFGVFEQKMRQTHAATYLNLKCSLAEAVMAHMAGRILELFKLVTDDNMSIEQVKDSSIESAALYAMRRFTNIPFN